MGDGASYCFGGYAEYYVVGTVCVDVGEFLTRLWLEFSVVKHNI